MSKIFTIKGLNGTQATIGRKIQKRSYVEGYIDASAVGVSGNAAGVAANRWATWLGTFVTAGEAGGAAAAFAVAEGTIAATLLTVAAPIIGGVLIGVGAGFGVRYVGRKLLNRVEELDLSEAVANGDIEIVDNADLLRLVQEEKTGFQLFSDPEWDVPAPKKATAVTTDKSVEAAAQAVVDAAAAATKAGAELADTVNKAAGAAA